MCDGVYSRTNGVKLEALADARLQALRLRGILSRDIRGMQHHIADTSRVAPLSMGNAPAS